MTDIFKPRILQLACPPRILVGIGGTSTTSVDTVAREMATAAQTSIDSITAQAGEIIVAAQGVISSDGRQFVNETGGDITLSGTTSSDLAADGLTAVAATFVGQTGFSFDDVAAMAASIELAVGQFVDVEGYFQKGDGGGNRYEIVAAGTGTHDGGSHIDLPGSGLQAKGLFKVGPRLEQWGVVKDGATDDAPRIQAALNWCAANGVRDLRVAGNSGQIAVSGQIVLKENVYIDFGYGTVIPLSNDAGFVLAKNSALENLKFSAETRQTWVGPMLLANDATDCSISAYPRLTNISCVGYKDTVGNLVAGVMLKLDATAGTRVSGLRASGLYASYLDTVVDFVPSAQGLAGWVNSNHLEFDMIYNCRTPFLMNRSATDREIANNYIKATYQPGPTEQAEILSCNGNQNEFDLLVWDLGAPGDPNIVDFGPNSLSNLVRGSLNPKFVRDTGTNSNRNEVVTRTSSIASFLKQAIEPSSTNSGTFLGQVDNCLAYADKRYVVTAPAPTTGAISYTFTPNANARAKWSNLTSLVIGIDLLAPQAALRTLGVAFTDAFVPDTVVFETSSDGVSWNEVATVPGSYIAAWTGRGFLGGSFQHIRITITSAVAQDFAISQIFGWWKNQQQGAYLPTGGGDLVGDAKFLSGKSILFASANGAGSAGLYVDNSNRLNVSASGGVVLNGTRILGNQQPALSDPSGGSVVDVECRAALIALADRIRNHGLIAL